MASADIETEKLFLAEVQAGNLKVSEDGKIVNVRTGHEFKVNEDRYKQITFRIDGEKKFILAHRLVWITHNGLIDDPTIEINHKSGIKSENNLSNLELATGSENCQHAFDTGLSKKQKGQEHGRSKFTNDGVAELRRTFSEGRSTLQEFSQNNSVSLSTMHGLLTGKTWSHVVTGCEEKCKEVLIKNRHTLNNRNR